jgi:hypothetical protein
MPIFDEVDRTAAEPASHLVGLFDYLNASARREAVRVRATLEAMLEHYPEDHRAELVRRLRSRDDRLHRSSVFELVMHELLIRQGLRVVEIEPVLANGRAPDFLVEAPDGSQFYLEATIASGEAGADAGSDRRMREALQAIDEVVSPDFFLGVHTSGAPRSQVATGRLRRAVQAFVDGLDYDTARVNFEAQRPTPIFSMEHDGLRIVIDVIPKNTRQAGGRAIGSRVLPGGVVTPHVAIKSAIEGKAGRYGDLNLPYVIAVSALEEFANADSAIDALFGTEAVVVHADGRDEWVRNPDGAWRNRNGPVYTRVSAVLSTERLSAWDLGQRSLRLIHNPWAARPLGDVPLGVEVRRVVDERLVTVPGRSLREILELPEGWPESDPDD